MKRTWVILLALLLLAAPGAVQAQLIFTTNSGSITITGFYGDPVLVTIPSTTNGLPVTGIGPGAFSGCPSLASLTIPDSVISIGSNAFAACFSLTNVTMGANVTRIGDGAFEFTSLTSLTIPDRVIGLGSDAFAYCSSLTNVTIGTSVTNIGAYAFYQSGLTSVTIPNRVITIGSNAFADCSSLASVILGTNVTTIGSYAFYQSGLTSVTIPNRVITIGSNAFADCSSLASVILGTSVTTIGSYAFYQSGLTTVTISDSVTNIGDGAFESTGLAGLTIPNGVITIGSNAFAYCYWLNSVTIGARVTSIGAYAFYQSGLASLTIPDSVTSIGDLSFFECAGLTNVTLGNSLASIGDYSFSYCTGLTGLTIPDSLTHLGNDAFETCTSLTNVTIGNSLTLIGHSAFFDCTGLTSVTIGSGVTNIGDSAFALCGSLASVTIPGNVTTIGDEAFGITGLTNVIFEGNAPTPVGAPLLDDFNATVYYLSGATGWSSNFADIATMELTAIIITAHPSNGLVPLRVEFTSANVDRAGNAISNWNWAFGDGSTSTSRNPSHTYTTPGTFPAALIETNSNGFPVAGAGASITVSPPAVGFTAHPTNGAVPLRVSFTAEAVDSTGKAITRWDWAFGDGSTSTVRNPSHTYTTPGTFFPALIATNNVGGTVAGSGPAAITATPRGSLEVTISPAAAISAGAQWRVDGGAYQTNDAIVTNLPPTNVTVSFKTIPGFATPVSQTTTIISSDTSILTAFYLDTNKPILSITFPTNAQRCSNSTITVKGTARDNVQVFTVFYQINGGSWTNAGTTRNSWSNWTASVTLTNGSNMVRAYAVDTSGNNSSTNKVIFYYSPSATLTVQTNGYGTVTPNDNNKLLVIGTNYTLTATPGHNCLFSNWVASGSTNFVSTNRVLTFTMTSNLTLTANFVTNFFLAAQGAYHGLFAPENAPRQQTDSGSFALNVTSNGAFSGKLYLASETNSLAGQFDLGGSATVHSTRLRQNPLTTTFNLDLTGQSVFGTVSDGSFTANLHGDQAVFNTAHQASNYKGQYTLIIRGTNDTNIGPFGASYGTVTVDASGNITFAGGLADGTTSVSQSSVISKDGYWWFYVPLYGGKGSLWGANFFTNHAIISLPFLSWINATNSNPGAFYRTGFTNEQASVLGSLYNPASHPLLSLTNAQVTLEAVNPAFPITNQVTLTRTNTIIVAHNTENTNGLTLRITPGTGLITGTFRNPLNAHQTNTIHGVLLQSNSAQGYFLGTNQNGAFLLGPR